MYLARGVLALGILASAAPSLAQVAPYEWVTQGGRNSIIDSNTESCDKSPFAARGAFGRSWSGLLQPTAPPCSAAPNQICDLQLVGGALHRDLATNGGRGTNTCVAARRSAARQHTRRLLDRREHLQPQQRRLGPQLHVHGHWQLHL